MRNVVVVQGRLARPVEERVLPSSDRLATFDLTIPAVGRAGGATKASAPGRAETVPLAWFEPPAWLVELEVGDELTVVGRVRRRFYQRDGVQSRTEVVVEGAAPARRPARVVQLLNEAIAALSPAGESRESDEPAAMVAPKRREPRRKAPPTFP